MLAPMAGVTNAPFRALCRRFAPGLVYVNEMVLATALVHGNAKTDRMVTFGPDEHPRSLQLYGSDPVMMGRAVSSVCDTGTVDHLDLNFGCPAAKVTRKGGGGAVPARPALLRAIVRAAVRAAAPYSVPVTAKFRLGLHDGLLTHLRAGEVCEDEGVAAIALHARTVQQHYAGEGAVGSDRRAQGARHLDPGARQRRHLGGDRCRGDDADHRLRRRGRRPWLPRPAVALRRSRRRAGGPTGRRPAGTRPRRRRDDRSRSGVGRPPRRRARRAAGVSQAHVVVPDGIPRGR